MSKDDRGRQFDILDIAVANRGKELLARDSLSIEDVREWETDYDQLAGFARGNLDNSYVASQWAAEEPRYANAVPWLMAKVRAPVKYTARLYNDDISISGGGCCGCNMPATLPPIDTRGNYSTMAPRTGTAMPQTVGDAVKNFFGMPSTVPYAPYNSIAPLPPAAVAVSGDIANAVLIALLVGGIFYLIHYFTMKK